MGRGPGLDVGGAGPLRAVGEGHRLLERAGGPCRPGGGYAVEVTPEVVGELRRMPEVDPALSGRRGEGQAGLDGYCRDREGLTWLEVARRAVQVDGRDRDVMQAGPAGRHGERDRPKGLRVRRRVATGRWLRSGLGRLRIPASCPRLVV